MDLFAGSCETERPSPTRSIGTEQNDPVQEFFLQYPDFVYKPSIQPARQFDRLVKHKNWDVGSEAFQTALAQLQTAMLRQFDPSIELASCPTVEPPPESKPTTGAKTKKGKKRAKQKTKQATTAAINNTIPQGQEGGGGQSNTSIIADTDSVTPIVDHLGIFFKRYPDFDAVRDQTESVATQLGRLRRQQQWWGLRMGLWNIALGHYQRALVLQFNAWYGTDVDDLRTWHRVLRVIGTKTPGTVSECKQLIDSIHVNIVDLVDASLCPGSRRVTLFESRSELSEYTIFSKKFFPKEDAYAGGVLRYLLRRIF